MSPLLSAAEGKFRRAVRSQNRFVNFLAILGVPTVVGIWLSVTSPTEIGALPFWIVTVVLIALQIFLYFVTTTYAETVPELHLEKCELEEIQDHMAGAIEEGDAYIRWLEAANTLGAFWSTFQGLIAILQPVDDDKLKGACRIAVSPMIDAAGVLFNFGYAEVWSATVYRVNETGTELQPVWWQRSEDHPSQGGPRNWRPGDGHVGSAFMQDRILFTTEMANDDASMLLKPSVTNGRPYDNEIYRSFVSAPILWTLRMAPCDLACWWLRAMWLDVLTRRINRLWPTLPRSSRTYFTGTSLRTIGKHIRFCVWQKPHHHDMAKAVVKMGSR